MKNISFPEPTVTPITKPFWDEIANHRFTLQQCDDCNEWIFYPRAHCPHCFGSRLNWKEASGKGSLKSWSIVHRAGHPAWQEKAPYVVGVVELEEGPSLLSHILVPSEELAYRMPLMVTYEQIGSYTLPFFKKQEEQS